MGSSLLNAEQRRVHAEEWFLLSSFLLTPTLFLLTQSTYPANPFIAQQGQRLAGSSPLTSAAR